MLSDKARFHFTADVRQTATIKEMVHDFDASSSSGYTIEAGRARKKLGEHDRSWKSTIEAGRARKKRKIFTKLALRLKNSCSKPTDLKNRTGSRN